MTELSLQQQNANPNNSQFEEFWNKLENEIKRIYASKGHDEPKSQYIDLYNQVFEFCSHSPQPNAFRYLYEKVYAYLSSYVFNAIKFNHNFENEEQLLRNYLNQWKDYRFSSKILNGIFSYLNRHYIRCRRSEGVDDIHEIYDLALILWGTYFVDNYYVILTNNLLKIIEYERNGQIIDTKLMDDVLLSYTELIPNSQFNAYSEFEKTFAEETQKFYTNASENYIGRNSFRSYLEKVKVWYSAEQKRNQLYLKESTLHVSHTILNRVLIDEHSDRFVDEFNKILDGYQNDDLGVIYKIVLPCDTTNEKIVNCFIMHVISRGLNEIRESVDNIQNNPILFVSIVLSVRDIYKNLIEKQFNNDNALITALDDACKYFVNDNELTIKNKSDTKAAEIMAKSFDASLKRHQSFGDEQQFSEELDRAILVLNYLRDLDAFRIFYRHFLAKRLLQQKSSTDKENDTLSALQHMITVIHTKKMQTMIADINESKNLNKQFKKHLETCKIKLKMKFYIHVLSYAAWPINPSYKMNLPSSMKKVKDEFKKFYTNSNNTRLLKWLFSMSNGMLKSYCFDKRYTFIASTFEITVLYRFNKNERQSLKELIEKTKLKRPMLVSVIKILIEAKLLIIEGNGDIDNMTDETVVVLNVNFTSDQLQVNINYPAIESAEQRQVNDEIRQDRSDQINCAIVRIMKKKKRMKRVQLLSQVFQQLKSRFEPTIELIEECVENMITREFIRKSKNEEILEYLTENMESETESDDDSSAQVVIVADDDDDD